MHGNNGGNEDDTLRQLNDAYISAVQSSDTGRFEQILAADFLNSNPDGTLVDRAGFLAQIAAPAKISNLAAHDVRIRVLGETAIIHGRTTYTGGGRPGGGGPLHGRLGAARRPLALRCRSRNARMSRGGRLLQ